MEAEQLQQLVGSLVQTAESGRNAGVADVNVLVQQTVRQVLNGCSTPVVLRSRLADSLPAAACPPGKLAHALHRALQLGIAHAGHGGRVELCTRADDDQLVVELLADGGGSPETQGRAATLAEFVAEWGGNCRIAGDEQGELLLSLELPTTDVFDDRHSD